MPTSIIRRPVLAIDLDDTLVRCDHHREVARLYGLDPEARYSYGYDEMPEEARREVFRRFESPEHNRHPVPIPGAETAVRFLSGLYDIHVVTARPPSIEEVTRLSISELFPDVKKVWCVGFRGDKIPVLEELSAFALIDDGAHNITAVVERSPGVLPILISNDETTWNHGARDALILRGAKVAETMPKAARRFLYPVPAERGGRE